MVVTKKKPTKFVLKKKSTDTQPIEDNNNTNINSNSTNIDNNNNEQTEEKIIVTKPILKKNKVENEEKKKVIFQTEKNQTQLFNKTLKISDKPLIMPKVINGSIDPSTTTTTTTTTTTKSNKVTKSTTSKKSTKATKTTPTNTTKKSNKKQKVVEQVEEEVEEQDQPIIEEVEQEQEEQPVEQVENNEPIVEEEKQIIEQLEEDEPIVQEEKEEPKNKNNKNNKNKKVEDNKNKKSKKEKILSDSDSDSDLELNNNNNSKNKNQTSTISGFNILPISIENSVFKKYLYCKKETSKKWPTNKTLFVTNLPSNCKTIEDIKKLFKYDFIESVHFGQPKQQQQHEQQQFEEGEEKIDETTLHVAHIVMKDQDSLQLFLKKSHTLSIQQKSTPINNFDLMLNQYNENVVQDYNELQEKLDNIMMDYDKRALETKKRSKQRQVPDEDGFITVGPSSAKIMTAEEVKALLAKKEKKNFYAFQHRQQKKDELETLRKKFEEDKQKIAKITAARKFKPY